MNTNKLTRYVNEVWKPRDRVEGALMDVIQGIVPDLASSLGGGDLDAAVRDYVGDLVHDIQQMGYSHTFPAHADGEVEILRKMPKAKLKKLLDKVSKGWG